MKIIENCTTALYNELVKQFGENCLPSVEVVLLMDAILKQPVVMRYTGQVVWNDPVIITPNIPDGIFDCE